MLAFGTPARCWVASPRIAPSAPLINPCANPRQPKASITCHLPKFRVSSIADAVGSPPTAPNEATSTSQLPNQDVLETWRKASAVCFDVYDCGMHAFTIFTFFYHLSCNRDCTVCVNDSLDLLAEFMGVGQAVADLTNKAMNGQMTLEEAITERLRIINCSPADIQRFLVAHPPQTRLVCGARELIDTLQARGQWLSKAMISLLWLCHVYTHRYCRLFDKWGI